ncbi:hypothetical protein RvY_14950 [Ramazzottius varieornatus]|uniref:Reverse transcriptase domain-containing protein n=1 Tax=Ramazzottius varieornatus TaxID=947166 RepID=A0A1D1VT34_RAMVA|nr:hypothetical protein RvY_14950 [Ramazzottius varieornatus]
MRAVAKAPVPITPCTSASSAGTALTLLPSVQISEIPQSPATPLKPSQFAIELKDHPDQCFIHQFLHGLRHGLKIGHQGPNQQRSTPNAATTRAHPNIAASLIAKEVKLNHSVGPFDSPPFPFFVTSSLGLRPKKIGGGRMIMDLSRPRDLSVNDYISKADYTLNYCNVDDAVALIIKAGRSCLLAKTDLVGVFRIIPVHHSDWNLLGYYFDGRYYYDRVLPFGLRSSPAIFNQLSLLLVWPLKHNGPPYVLHYMDDFLFVGKAESDVCDAAPSFMELLCQHLGVPLAPEKTVLPTTRLEFPGITTDATSMDLFTDASGAIGCGAIFGDQWCQVLGRAWRKQSSAHRGVMDLIRRIHLQAARGNYTVRIIHIPGRQDGAADAVSHNDLPRFRSLQPSADSFM